MTLIERLLAQANKEANELADLLYEAANALKRQEPAWWPAVKNILDEHGLQAIEFVADFKAAMAQPKQDAASVTVRYDLSPAMIEGALKQKLIDLGWTPPAQPQQEPQARNPAKCTQCGGELMSAFTSVCYGCGQSNKPSPARKPLTEDEIDVILEKQRARPFKTHGEDRVAFAFARAIEAAHGIKP